VHIARDDDTKQKRVCTVHKKYTSIYTPYSLSGEFTACRCGTKPQRLLMSVRRTVMRLCAWHMEKLYTPYLLSEGENLVHTVCIHVERGCFLCIRLV